MIESRELKPCPFCGGEAYTEGHEVELREGFGFWFVSCKNQCGAVVGYFLTEDDARRAWNKRYNENDINREKPKRERSV